MADYIDRKALLDSICGNIRVTHRPGEPSLEIRGANKVINFIEEAPAVDVDLVRHGKWINIDTNECWACSRYNQQEGKCDTWCDHGECFELHPVLKNAPKEEA